jgi:hypothetical protein
LAATFGFALPLPFLFSFASILFGAQSHGEHVTAEVFYLRADAQDESIAGQLDEDVTAEREEDNAVRPDDVTDLVGVKLVLDAIVGNVRAITAVGESREESATARGLGVGAGNLSHGMDRCFFHSAAEGEGGKRTAKQGDNPEGLHSKVSKEFIGNMARNWSEIRVASGYFCTLGLTSRGAVR